MAICYNKYTFKSNCKKIKRSENVNDRGIISEQSI